MDKPKATELFKQHGERFKLEIIETIPDAKVSLYTDGGRLRMVAWRTRKAVYWLSNTLSVDLSNAEMLDIAASTRWVVASVSAP